MSEPVNPYAAPTATSNPLLLQQGGAPYAVRDNQLVVEKYVELPAFCYKTGDAVVAGVDGKVYRKTINYSSPWLALLILLGAIGIIVYVITHCCTRKPVVVGYHLSDKAIKKLFRKRLIAYSICGLILGVSILGITQGNSYGINSSFIVLGFAGIAVALISALVTASVTNVMRVKKHVYGSFYLAGAGQAFINRLR